MHGKPRLCALPERRRVPSGVRLFDRDRHATCGGQATCPTDATTCCGDRCADVNEMRYTAAIAAPPAALAAFARKTAANKPCSQTSARAKRRPSALDVYDDDNAAAGTIQAALSAGCTPAPTMTSVALSLADSSTRRPGDR